MEEVFHKIYTNSEINIQNIKLISSHPPFFFIEITTCSGVVTSGYDMYLDHILVWNIVCWFVTTSGQKKRNVYYCIILTYYFNAYEKNTREWGREWRPFNPGEVYSLSWSLSMYSLLEKSLRKGLFKGSGCSKTCNIFVFKVCSYYSISMCQHRLNLFTLYPMIHSQALSYFIIMLCI